MSSSSSSSRQTIHIFRAALKDGEFKVSSISSRHKQIWAGFVVEDWCVSGSLHHHVHLALCAESWRLVGHSLNTGVKSDLLSASNALKEGGGVPALFWRSALILPMLLLTLAPLCLTLPSKKKKHSSSSSHWCFSATDLILVMGYHLLCVCARAFCFFFYLTGSSRMESVNSALTITVWWHMWLTWR